MEDERGKRRRSDSPSEPGNGKPQDDAGHGDAIMQEFRLHVEWLDKQQVLCLCRTACIPRSDIHEWSASTCTGDSERRGSASSRQQPGPVQLWSKLASAAIRQRRSGGSSDTSAASGVFGCYIDFARNIDANDRTLESRQSRAIPCGRTCARTATDSATGSVFAAADLATRAHHA